MAAKAKTTVILLDVDGSEIYRTDTTREVNFIGIYTHADEEHGLSMSTKHSKTRKGAASQAYIGQALEVIELETNEAGERVGHSRRVRPTGRPNHWTRTIEVV